MKAYVQYNYSFMYIHVHCHSSSLTNMANWSTLVRTTYNYAISLVHLYIREGVLIQYSYAFACIHVSMHTNECTWTGKQCSHGTVISMRHDQCTHGSTVCTESKLHTTQTACMGIHYSVQHNIVHVYWITESCTIEQTRVQVHLFS